MTAKKLSELSRSEIQVMLRELANAPVPVPESQNAGAMCYTVVAPPTRADYVCPECGERTLYEIDLASTIEWALPAARHNFQQLCEVAVGAILDESQFCRKCRPEVDLPQLGLKVTYEGNDVQEVSGVRSEDLRILHEFFAGMRLHNAGMSGDRPLKEHLPRLQELLGVTRT
jgi:hypothetical protein